MTTTSITYTDLPLGLVLCENCGTPVHADDTREVCTTSGFDPTFCSDQCHLAWHDLTRTRCSELGD